MRKIIHWLIICLVFLCVGNTNVAWASFPAIGPPAEILKKSRELGIASIGDGYDISKEKTLAGVIKEIATSSGKGDLSNYMVEVTIEGKSGKLCKAQLAPYWYIQSQRFRLPKGGDIKVRGFLKPDGDDYRMLATAIMDGKRTLTIRNSRGIPLWSVKPQGKVGLKAGVVSSSQRGVVNVTGDLSPDVDTQRPEDYGPPDPDPEELPWWLGWAAQSLNTMLEFVGGPESALLIMLGLLLVVMIRTLTSKKKSWRKIKSNHGKI